MIQLLDWDYFYFITAVADKALLLVSSLSKSEKSTMLATVITVINRKIRFRFFNVRFHFRFGITNFKKNIYKKKKNAKNSLNNVNF